MEINGFEWMVFVYGGGFDCSFFGNVFECGYGLMFVCDYFVVVVFLWVILVDGFVY